MRCVCVVVCLRESVTGKNHPFCMKHSHNIIYTKHSPTTTPPPPHFRAKRNKTHCKLISILHHLTTPSLNPPAREKSMASVLGPLLLSPSSSKKKKPTSHQPKPTTRWVLPKTHNSRPFPAGFCLGGVSFSPLLGKADPPTKLARSPRWPSQKTHPHNSSCSSLAQTFLAGQAKEITVCAREDISSPSGPRTSASGTSTACFVCLNAYLPVRAVFFHVGCNAR